ncbi:MAG: hypothetical protein GX969_05510 [Firmicutes bacterium]|nr:hypothetical protein [Bacillota bacterium]
MQTFFSGPEEDVLCSMKPLLQKRIENGWVLSGKTPRLSNDMRNVTGIVV